MTNETIQQRERRLERIVRLAKKAHEIVGFGAVQEMGSSLNKREIDIIAKYCEARGADYESVAEVLRSRGRPFSTMDQSFAEKCYLCRNLRNYCCC